MSNIVATYSSKLIPRTRDLTIGSYSVVQAVAFCGMAISLVALLSPYILEPMWKPAAKSDVETCYLRARDAQHTEDITQPLDIQAEDEPEDTAETTNIETIQVVEASSSKVRFNLEEPCDDISHVQKKNEEEGRARSASDPSSDRPTKRLSKICSKCIPSMDKAKLESIIQPKPIQAAITGIRRNSIAAASSISKTVKKVDSTIDVLEADMRKIPSKVAVLPEFGGKVIVGACKTLKNTTTTVCRPPVKMLMGKTKDTTQVTVSDATHTEVLQKQEEIIEVSTESVAQA